MGHDVLHEKSCFFRNYKFEVNPIKKNRFTFLLGLILIIIGLITWSFMKSIKEY